MNTTSLKSIIYRLTSYRIADATYLDDLLEWLPQGMGHLKTRMSLQKDYKDENVVEHVAFYPCGMVKMDAIESLEINGEKYKHRLREGSNLRALATSVETEESGDLYVSDPLSVQRVYIPTDQITEEGDLIDEGYYTEYRFVGYRSLVPYNGQDIKRAKTINVATPYYVPQPGGIHTSFKYGKVRFHYLKVPLDKEGYPLIPDNENYKTALEWYAWSQMIAAGYQHPIFDYEYCWQKFEIFARRAINEINYPSPDKMERYLQSHVRLIPPQDYYQTFSTNSYKSNEQLL